ncbi:MAG TPA: GntR family transcriptional regulator [Clostridiales bacterium]|nr:GntR family transcriptional regulator [Clostridiales bacterium]
MEWELSSDRPIYIQLIEQLQAAIIAGNLSPGDKIPSVRDLASEAQVNPNTMQKALAELERNGLLYTERTSGRYITSDKELIMKLKKQSAKSQIQEFIEKMKLMGFQPEETLALIEETIKDK